MYKLHAHIKSILHFIRVLHKNSNYLILFWKFISTFYFNIFLSQEDAINTHSGFHFMISILYRSPRPIGNNTPGFKRALNLPCLYICCSCIGVVDRLKISRSFSPLFNEWWWYLLCSFLPVKLLYCTGPEEISLPFVPGLVAEDVAELF